MHTASIIPALVPQTLAAIFAFAGSVHLIGPRALRELHVRWGYTRGFRRLIGVLGLMTGIFPAVPQTRVWGVTFGAFILFVAVVTLLNHRKYLYAVAGILLLAALPPALVAGPF